MLNLAAAGEIRGLTGRGQPSVVMERGTRLHMRGHGAPSCRWEGEGAASRNLCSLPDKLLPKSAKDLARSLRYSVGSGQQKGDLMTEELGKADGTVGEATALWRGARSSRLLDTLPAHGGRQPG